MATRFKKPITREIDLPVTEELTKNGTCKVAPHVITFDDVGVAIRRKNSKTVLFAEWKQIFLNRLNTGIFHTQESAEEEREMRRAESTPTKRKAPRAKKKKTGLRESPVSDESDAVRPEPPPETEEDRVTGSTCISVEEQELLGRAIDHEMRKQEVVDSINDTVDRLNEKQEKGPTKTIAEELEEEFPF